jgi:hypothetical protein
MLREFSAENETTMNYSSSAARHVRLGSFLRDVSILLRDFEGAFAEEGDPWEEEA